MVIKFDKVSNVPYGHKIHGGGPGKVTVTDTPKQKPKPGTDEYRAAMMDAIGKLKQNPPKLKQNPLETATENSSFSLRDKLAALLEEKIDQKLRAERLKRKDKAYDNRVHRNSTAQPRDEDPPPSDDELKDMAKHYEEAKELNPTSFQPDVAAGLNKLMAGVNARKKQKAEAEAKAEAAQPAKKEESANLKDRMVEALAQKLTESPMEFNYRRETPEEKAKNKARVEQLRREAKAKKKPSGESKPEADGGEGTKPGSYFTNRHGGRTEN
jgi:hypothetical protein